MSNEFTPPVIRTQHFGHLSLHVRSCSFVSSRSLPLTLIHPFLTPSIFESNDKKENSGINKEKCPYKRKENRSKPLTSALPPHTAPYTAHRLRNPTSQTTHPLGDLEREPDSALDNHVDQVNDGEDARAKCTEGGQSGDTP